MKYLLFLAVFCVFSPLKAEDIKTNRIPGDARTHSVLVSLSPDKQFVKKIAGDLIKVYSIVPDGSDPHTFEPTPKQMVNASECDIWFYVGEGFEIKALPALKSHSNRLTLIDLRKNINLIKGDGHHDCPSCASDADLHFWLSAKEAQIQTKTIYDALILQYPEHAAVFSENFREFIEELKALDSELTELLAPVKNRNFMVSHPAFAYFCRDYDLNQISIEFEGRAPTPQQLTTILEVARKDHIRIIVGLSHLSNKGVLLIGKELGAEVLILDPHHDSLSDTLRKLVAAIVRQSQSGHR